MAEAALPDAVLLRVLALLPLRDRLRAAGVSRRWRRLVRERCLWRDADLSQRPISCQHLQRVMRQYFHEGLRTLRLRGWLLSCRNRRLLTPKLLEALEERCPQLRRLCLAEADLRPLRCLTVPRSVTTLELRRCEIPAAGFRGFGLQHLVVHDVPAFADGHLLDVSSWSRLKTLSLSGTYRVTQKGIYQAAPRLEELERLALHCCGLGDSAVGSVGCHMRQLRFLEIGEANALTDAGLAALARLELLETLHLDLCEKISPDAVIALGRALPRLQSLELGGDAFEGEIINEIRASLPRCRVSLAPQRAA